MRDVTVPLVDRPERFLPDPVLKGPVQREDQDDGSARMYVPAKQKWGRIPPLGVSILDGLEAGHTFQELVELTPLGPVPNRKLMEKVVRRWVWKLHEAGIVELDLPAAPDVFDGRYERVEELGRGAFGIVHLCRDRDASNAPVTVKHAWGIKHDVQHSQRNLAREIATLKRLDHPGIPTLRGTFEQDGLLHMVRDYVDGRPLSSAFKRRRRRDRAERLRAAGDIADALGHLHERGFVFFDVSPGNFMERTQDERIVVIDLGSARPIEPDGLRVRGQPGTPGYIASEFLLATPPGGRIATPAADVCGLGRLYYFLTVGKRPQRRWLHKDIVADLVEREADERDRAIIDRLCLDDRRERPQDMAAVAALLR